MIDYLDLARRLRGRSLGASFGTNLADALMPRAYQFANPSGRPYHDDWRAPWIPAALQPWGRVRRMDTTFLLPLPMKLAWSTGGVRSSLVPWQPNYVGGLAPGFELCDVGGIPHVEVYHPVLPSGQEAIYSVWLDGQWRPCFYTSTRTVFGRRLHHNRGLKPDVTLGDFMWNFPEASLTWTKERA